MRSGTLKSKTFWMGVVGIAGGVVAIVFGETEKGVQAIVAGVGMIFARDAIEKAIEK